MVPPEPIRYRIKFTPERVTNRCGPNGQKKFSVPVSREGPKLYIISNGTEPIYVGGTNRPMGERLRAGFQSNGRNGYSGYLWRHYLSKAALDVWPLEFKEEDYEAVKSDPSAMRTCSNWERLRNILIEAVEAEVVFLLRKRYDQWPRYQTEIHFQQSLGAHRRAAETIVNYYTRSPNAQSPD